MKQLLRLQLLLLLPTAALAQSANPAMWCPAGATWTYGYSLFAERGTLTVRYARDTVVAGQPAQVLTRQLTTVVYPGPMPGGNTYQPPVVTRVVGQRVEVLANGQFYTLYDFAAQPGTSWLTPPVIPQGPCSQNLSRITVDSVGVQQLGGRTLRWFRAHLSSTAGLPYAFDWSGRVYELVGSTGAYMQPQVPGCANTDPGYLGPFATFAAAGAAPLSVHPQNGYLALGVRARAEAAGFVAYPSPSGGAGWLAVQLPARLMPSARLEVLDVAGRQVRQQAAIAGQRLDVRGLAAGTYTLRLRVPGAASYFQRVVLE